MIERLRKLIKKDPETKDLVLTDQEVYEVARYLSEKAQGGREGYLPKLVLTPYIHVVHVPTKEKEIETANKKLQVYLENFDAEVYIQNVSLDSYVPKNDQHQNVYNYLKKFIENDFKEPMQGAYLFGPYKAGKTYLLSALANELAKNQKSVVFAYMPDFSRSMKASIGNNTLERKINLLKRCDCFILDDLGGYSITPWFRDEILLPILQYRLSACLPVFISSNFSLKELAVSIIFNQNDQEEKQKVGRVMERIKDLCKFFEVSHDDKKTTSNQK